MSNTKIEWADKSWTTVHGCTEVSPGCHNCYAKRLVATRLRNHPHYAGKAIKGGRYGYLWTKGIYCDSFAVEKPRRWTKSTHRIFVNPLSDTFHEAVPFGFIEDMFATMVSPALRRHLFLLLTKRPGRVAEFLDYLTDCRSHWFDADGNLSRGNIWIGISTEDQQRFDYRTRIMVQRVRERLPWFISAEPLIGPIRFSLRGLRRLKVVIAGGESGFGSTIRPAHPEWFFKLQDDCLAANVPMYFKQWGRFVSAAEYDGPEARDPDKVLFVHTDGSVNFGPIPQSPPWHMMYDVGKKKAGAKLGGKIYQRWPRWR